jgi:hypothetical protein
MKWARLSCSMCTHNVRNSAFVESYCTRTYHTGKPRMTVHFPLFPHLLPEVHFLRRAETEGAKGNGLSGELYRCIRMLSLDPSHDLGIPAYAWGIWPRFAKEVRPGIVRRPHKHTDTVKFDANTMRTKLQAYDGAYT